MQFILDKLNDCPPLSSEAQHLLALEFRKREGVLWSALCGHPYIYNMVRRQMGGRTLGVRGLQREDPTRAVLHRTRKAVHDLASTSPLTAEFTEYLDGVRAAEAAYERVKNRFVQANLRLVVRVVKRYSKASGAMDMVDLVQEGNIGLLKAVERYDPGRGYKFSTYATWWIRHHVGRSKADKAGAVRVPVYQQQTSYRVNRARNELAATLGRKPTAKEVAAEVGVEAERVMRMDSLPTQASSLDAPVGEDGATMGDLLESDEESAEDRAATRGAAMAVINEFHRLSPVEQRVLGYRYGLLGEELTLSEIGHRVGLTRERVRQIQNGALEKLRVFTSALEDV